MQLLGQIHHPRAAQAFGDYLHQHGIECRIEDTGTGFNLWLLNADDLTRASAEFEDFIANPNQAKYLDASWQSSRPQVKLQYGDSSWGLLQNFLIHAGPLTLGIFSACIAIYAIAHLAWPGLYDLLAYFPNYGADQLAQGWRLLTPALLHFSLMHLVFNLLWWWYLGGQIERKLGAGKLLWLLLLAAALPNAVQYAASGPLFGGLSGVVYALVGYFWWMGRLCPKAGIGLPTAYIVFMLIWLVMGWFDVLGLNTANGAHLAGLIVGCIQGWLDARSLNRQAS